MSTDLNGKAFAPDPAASTAKTAAIPSHWLADVYLMFTAIVWGVNIPIFKQAVGVLDQWVFNALRLAFATLTLGICAWFEVRDAKRVPLTLRRVSQILLFAFLSGFLYQVVFVLGMQRTTAGNTALLLSSMPMWTAILSYFFLQERLPRQTWIGLGITFLGTAIVTLQSGTVSLSSQYFIGNLFMLGAAMTWAAGTVMSRPMLSTISPLRLAFLSNLLTTPFHLLIAAPAIPGQWDEATAYPTFLSILFSGVFSTGIAYATWYAGVRQVGGSHASVYQNVVTLVAVLGGWIFLGEQPMVAQVIGGLLIVAGLFVMRRSRG